MPRMLVPDRSGKLLRNRFFRLMVDPDARSRRAELARRGGVVAVPALRHYQDLNPKTGELIEFLVVELTAEPISERKCGKERLEHTTGSFFDTRGVAMTVRHGLDANPFVEIWPPDYGTIAATRELADGIAQKQFRGIGIAPVRLKSREGRSSEVQLSLLFPMGAYCMKPFIIEGGGENKCPLCGRGRPICTECGMSSIECQFCGEAMWRTINDSRYGTDDPRFYICPNDMRKEEIINGQKWDGADYFCGFNGGYVSKRFVTYLQSVHAAPFVAEPALICIDGMSPEQLRWLEEVSGPLEKK